MDENTIISKTAHTVVTEVAAGNNPTTGAKNQFLVHSTATGELLQTVNFHTGKIDHGANGAFLEDYLTCCAVRLEGFQLGPFACEQNAEALHHIHQALFALNRRTTSIVESKQ